MKSGFLYQYYYLWSGALIVPIWAFLFWKKNRSREEMIYVGLLCGVAGLCFDKYSSFLDYWHPPTVSSLINFESFLYSFFMGGITSKVYEFVFRKEYAAQAPPKSLFVVGVVFGNCVMYIVLGVLFRCNSAILYVYMLLITSAFLLLIKPSLYKTCLASGALMVGVTIGWYTAILLIYPSAIDDIWLKSALGGVYIFGIPIEEFWFAFAAGCLGSIMYKAAPGFWLEQFEEGEPPRSCNEPAKPSGSGTSMFKILKPYSVPLAMLIIVLGRMLIFGKAPIDLSKLFYMLQ